MSKLNSKNFALSLLVLANLAVTTSVQAIAIANTDRGTKADSRTNSNDDPIPMGRKTLAQRRAACFSKALDNLFDDQNECNKHRSSTDRKECKAVAYLSYQIEQGKCNRMQ